MKQDSADGPGDQSLSEFWQGRVFAVALLALRRVRRHHEALRERGFIAPAGVRKVNGVHEDAIVGHHTHTERESVRVGAGLPHAYLERFRSLRLVVCLYPVHTIRRFGWKENSMRPTRCP